MDTLHCLIQADDKHFEQVLTYLKGEQPGGEGMEIVFSQPLSSIEAAHKKGNLFVSVDQDSLRVRGFIEGVVSKGWLHRMEVWGPFRGGGIGSLMVKAFAERAERSGAFGLYGQCAWKALQFWRRNGFGCAVGRAADSLLDEWCRVNLSHGLTLKCDGPDLYRPLPQRRAPAEYGTQEQESVDVIIELASGDSGGVIHGFEVEGSRIGDEVSLSLDWVVACSDQLTRMRFCVGEKCTQWDSFESFDWVGVERQGVFIRVRKLGAGELEIL